MAKGKQSAVCEVLEDKAAGRLDFFHARTLAYSIAGEMEKLEAIVDEELERYKTSHSAEVRSRSAMLAGVGLWIMRKFGEACDILKCVKNHPEAAYILGLCQIETGDYGAAVKSLKKAEKAGQDAFACSMAAAEALRRADKCKEALARIGTFQKSHDSEGELHYQKGRCLEGEVDYEAATEAYERAVELNPQHVGALFRLAYWNDLRGNDDLALEYYEKASQVPPPYTNVLLNLGLLYESRGEYEKAAAAFERILTVNPTEARARMYYKDAVASMSMYYDEALERRQGRTAQLLRTPVADFELSARSRAFLEQMNVRALGDLARLTEEDVLQSKNLGETSLTELRNLLQSRGLHFGMGAEGERSQPEPAVAAQVDVLVKPIADLDLSIRSQKCMRTLGIQTVGDLIEKTEKELLLCPNFGQTSLNEVKSKLAGYGLALEPKGGA